jgi:hypothetical protein
VTRGQPAEVDIHLDTVFRALGVAREPYYFRQLGLDLPSRRLRRAEPIPKLD